MAIDQKIAEYITQNDQYMETALRVCMNIDAVRENLWEKTRTALEGIFPGESNVSKDIRGNRDDEGCYILIDIPHEHEHWRWQLYLYGNFTDLRKAVQFDGPEYCSGDILSNLNKELGYKINSEVSNLISSGDKYTSPWYTSDQPWLDMLTKEDGKEQSIFVSNIIKWYMYDRNIVQQCLKDNKVVTQ